MIANLRAPDERVDKVLPIGARQDKRLTVCHGELGNELARVCAEDRLVAAAKPVMRVEVDILDPADIGGGVDHHASTQHAAEDIADEMEFASGLADEDALVGVDKCDILDRVVHAVAVDGPRVGDDVLRALIRPEHGEPADATALFESDGCLPGLVAAPACDHQGRPLVPRPVVRRVPAPHQRDSRRHGQMAVDDVSTRAVGRPRRPSCPRRRGADWMASVSSTKPSPTTPAGFVWARSSERWGGREQGGGRSRRPQTSMFEYPCHHCKGSWVADV